MRTPRSIKRRASTQLRPISVSPYRARVSGVSSPDVERLWRLRLHAKSGLHSLNRRFELVVAGSGRQMLAIKSASRRTSFVCASGLSWGLMFRISSYGSVLVFFRKVP